VGALGKNQTGKRTVKKTVNPEANLERKNRVAVRLRNTVKVNTRGGLRMIES
jgi:hypothetical protein